MTINAKKRLGGNSHDKVPIPTTHLEELRKPVTQKYLLQIRTNTTAECYCYTILLDDSVITYWFSDCNIRYLFIPLACMVL
jgi:hypothetical protein